MKYEFIESNIVELNVDAIVLPANTHLKEGSGVSKAIFEAAGRKQLTKECDKIAFCSQGSAVPTSGFDLPASFIIHSVVPKWIDGKHNEYELLCASYLSALKIADVIGVKTIAFPLLASGNNGFDKNLAMEIAIKTIESYKAENLQIALVVLYGRNACLEASKYGYCGSNLNHSNYEISKNDSLLDNAMSVAGDFFYNGMKLALEWIENEDNQKIIIEIAGKLVKDMFIK